SLLRCCW
ncbi:hypothetical protein CP061683_0467B, partial [Chlamydia psittaci 06-1683]